MGTITLPTIRVTPLLANTFLAHQNKTLLTQNPNNVVPYANRNGARGSRDIEGKATRVAARELGNDRVSNR